MDIIRTVQRLNALAQTTRLGAFRHLIKAHPDGLLAGEVARLCKVPHNTMSTHLAALARARLVIAERDGRTITYRADLDGFRQLILFLTRDCCRGQPEICAPLLADLSCSVSSKRENVRA
jgi:DNA-binding transcriptional ArsR family regulator